MIKIYVDTEEEKQELLNQSKYIHDFVEVVNGTRYIGLDSDKAGTLMHIYMAPEIIIVREDELRQSGRTTRIMDFTIEQLCSVGECVVTDHTVFEYPNKVTNNNLKEFIKRVNGRLQYQTNGYRSCKGEIKKLDDIKVIHFKINQNKDE